MPVDRLGQFGQGGVALLRPGHLPQRLPLAGQRLGRGFQVQIPVVAAVEVSVEPEGVAQKVQARLGFFQFHHPRLFPVHRQSQPPFQLGLKEAPQSLALIPRQHHKVVRIPHQLGLGPLGRPVGALKRFVEPVQIDVRQQRRNNSALRCAPVVTLDCGRPSLLLLHYRGLQPHPYQAQHRPVHYSHPHARQ